MMLFHLLVILLAGVSAEISARPPPGGGKKAKAPAGAQAGVGQGYTQPAIPNHVQELVMPELKYGDRANAMHYEIPQEVVTAYLKKAPDQAMKKLFSNIYSGYKNAKRMKDVVQLLGDEVFDTVVQYMLYDFMSNVCKWTSNVWGTEINGWQYVQIQESCVFNDVKTTISDEVNGWFEWWMEREASKGNVMYSDCLLSWATGIASQMYSLKGAEFEVSPQGPRGMKSHTKSVETVTPAYDTQYDMDRSDEIPDIDRPQSQSKRNPSMKDSKFKGKPKGQGKAGARKRNAAERKAAGGKGKGAANRQLLGDCPMHNPAELFGEKFKHVRDYIEVNLAQDFTLGVPLPKEFTVQVTVNTHACDELCMGLGAGLTWDVMNNDVFIHWSYGFGQLADVRSDVLAEVAFFDSGTSKVFDGFYKVGIQPSKIGVNYFFDKNWKFNGVSFTMAKENDANSNSVNNNGKLKVHTFWEYSGRIAKLKQAALSRYSFAQLPAVNHSKHVPSQNPSWYYFVFLTLVALLGVAMCKYGRCGDKHSGGELQPLLPTSSTRV